MKEATQIQEGSVLNYTAGATIANGDVIPLAERIGIAMDDAVAGDVISLKVVGVFEFVGTTADTFTFGTKCYFDATAREITTVSTDNTLAGFATTAKAGSAVGNVQVRIG